MHGPTNIYFYTSIYNLKQYSSKYELCFICSQITMYFSVDFITQFKAPVWFPKGLLICNLHLYGQECIPKS